MVEQSTLNHQSQIRYCCKQNNSAIMEFQVLQRNSFFDFTFRDILLTFFCVSLGTGHFVVES